MVRELGSAAFPFSAPPFSGVRLDIISRVTRCVISSCAEDFGISADSYPVAMTNISRSSTNFPEDFLIAAVPMTYYHMKCSQ